MNKGEKERVKTALDRIHPLVIDLIEVFKKHTEKIRELESGVEKEVYLDTLKDILDVIYEAYKADVIRDIGDYFEFDSIETLFREYLKLAYLSAKNTEEQ